MYLPLIHTHFQCISWLFNHEKVLISKNTAPLLALKTILCNVVDSKFYFSYYSNSYVLLKDILYYKWNRKVQQDKEPKDPQNKFYLNAIYYLYPNAYLFPEK